MTRTKKITILLCIAISVSLFFAGTTLAILEAKNEGGPFSWKSVIYTVLFGACGSLIASLISLYLSRPDFASMHKDIAPIIHASTNEYFIEFNRSNQIFFHLREEGIRHLYSNSGGLNDEDWAEWLRTTPNNGAVYLLGISNSGWIEKMSRKALKEIIEQKGCSVYLYFLDPCPLEEPRYVNLRAPNDCENTRGDTISRINNAINEFLSVKKELKRKMGKLKLYKYNEMPTHAIYFNGVSMYIKHYLLDINNEQCPMSYFMIPTESYPWNLHKINPKNIAGDFRRDFISHLITIANHCSKSNLEIKS